MIGGQVQVYFGPVASSLPHIKAGKLRALAVTGAARSHVLPDVPPAWRLPAPVTSSARGTSRAHPGARRPRPSTGSTRAVNAVLDEPAFKAQIADMGGTLMPGSAAEFGKLIATEAEKVAKVIEGANITVEYARPCEPAPYAGTGRARWL